MHATCMESVPNPSMLHETCMYKLWQHAGSILHVAA